MSELLGHVLDAGAKISRFMDGGSFEQYIDDEMLRAAVERQFEIIGEALNNVRRLDAATASSIPDLKRIVNFRNLLSHGYAEVDDWFVWLTAQTQLPQLLIVVADARRQLSKD